MSGVTQLSRAVSYGEVLPPRKSHDPLYKWSSCKKLKIFFSTITILMAPNSPSHMTLWSRDHVSSCESKKSYMSTFTRNMVTKFQSFDLLLGGPSHKATKLFDHMRSHGKLKTLYLQFLFFSFWWLWTNVDVVLNSFEDVHYIFKFTYLKSN